MAKGGTQEEWTWVIGRKGKYKVSTFGRVRSVPRYCRIRNGGIRKVKGCILKPGKGDYLFVGLANGNNTNDRVNVHILVLEAFIGPCPEGMEARHLDGNSYNPKLSNLKWGTPVQNARDRVTHGTIVRGIKIKHSKLSPRKVHKIRRMLRKGMSQWDVGQVFGIHQVTVSEIHRKKIWKHI
jgi:hypothetical protein